MIRRLLLIATLGVMLSGCFMVPMAFIGPAASGFSTVSLIQSGVTTGASYMVKKSTGKTITEHAISALDSDVLQQTYFPKNHTSLIVPPR
jgi:starvation-inducible outer membrane lipoprotein